ncbi:MAG TPA: PEP-CTERM sorting domain-containing protein, partial [Methylophilaceae bacterium]|nr:PEP-CTERM sorting domain-containing protein [Methylophilaceae bacterium]
WRVNLGNDPSTWQATGIYTNASHSSSNWMQFSMVFTATSTSEMLSFLAAGTPSGEPPFSLLDGVSMYEVPEPASWLLMLLAMATIMAMRRRRRGCDTSR